MTTPQLLAAAMRKPCPIGAHQCFYCGASCGEDFPTSEYLADSFTAWNAVRLPGSKFVCGGCVLATDESDKSMRPRGASWIIADKAVRATKADMEAIRSACLTPPQPPFSIVISVSQQKHLLYLAPANYSRDIVTVQFEVGRVTFTPNGLAERLNLCKHICAATGKPVLAEAPFPSLSVQLSRIYAHFEQYLEWFDVWQQPVSRLAAFLCPAKQECLNEFPSNIITAPDLQRRSVPAEIGGVDGPGLFG